MKICFPSFKGCVHAGAKGNDRLYLIPTAGYMSLHGVLCALLHTINYDRVRKGLPPLEAHALDSTFLTTIPKADWMMPLWHHYLAFGV